MTCRSLVEHYSHIQDYLQDEEIEFLFKDSVVSIYVGGLLRSTHKVKEDFTRDHWHINQEAYDKRKAELDAKTNS